MPSPIPEADLSGIRRVSIIKSMTNILFIIWFNFSNRCTKILYEIRSFFKKIRNDSNQVQEESFQLSDTNLGEESPVYRALSQQVVLSNILSHLDGTEIAKLRKVSFGIRRYLDDTRPNPKITSFSINLRNFEIIMLTVNSKIIGYKQLLDGFSANQRSVCGDFDFRSILINDLEIMLRNQRDTIDTVSLNFATEPELFELLRSDILLGPIEKRRGPLKIKNLEMSVYNPKNIMSVLRHIDSQALKILHIKADRIGNVQRAIDLSAVVNLDQWKNAEQLVMDDFVIENGLQDLNLENKTHVEIVVKSLSIEDLVYLKQRFLTSPHHFYFHIGYKSLEDNNQNEWNLDEDDWYFQLIPNNQVLCVSRNEHAFTFSRIDATDVPMGADVVPYEPLV